MSLLVSIVASASHEVANTSEAVAQRAAPQSASVEKTTSSADEITALTQQNAKELRAAAELAGRTVQSIQEANQALNEMETSMHEIDSSCDKVGRIIRVIDEIAFQTSMLALNAAVQSARAGDAGMDSP